MGLFTGDQSYGRYLASYYSYQDLVSYSDVDPAVAKGQTYMDSGQAKMRREHLLGPCEVYFKEGTTVDTSQARTDSHRCLSDRWCPSAAG